MENLISIDEFKKGEISIGQIKAVEEVPGSEKLLKLTVDFGEEVPRTVVSGIRKYFSDIEALVGVKCAFATNLEKRPLMGIESQAMILAVSNDEQFSLLTVNEHIPVGLKVR
jgi:methionyl-tRNA synthetase